MTTTDPAPQRILVDGVTGSGKSHAATRISRNLGLPLVLADDVAWQLGWHQVEPERQRELFAALAAGDQWVFDTAYGIWIDAPGRPDRGVGLSAMVLPAAAGTSDLSPASAAASRRGRTIRPGRRCTASAKPETSTVGSTRWPDSCPRGPGGLKPELHPRLEP